MSQLIQILLPTADNDGAAYSPTVFERIKSRLVDRFGGLTAYTQAPAEGVWARDDGKKSDDQIIVVEVMVDVLDETWWSAFREQLERDLAQAEIVIRAQEIKKL